MEILNIVLQFLPIKVFTSPISAINFVQVNLPVNVLSASFPGHGHGQAFNAPDDLPKTVMRNLNQGSSPMSMDFHPVQQTILLGLLLF